MSVEKVTESMNEMEMNKSAMFHAVPISNMESRASEAFPDARYVVDRGTLILEVPEFSCPPGLR